MRRGLAGALVGAVATLSPAAASAQEIDPSGLQNACILLLIHDAVPAHEEPSFWITGGGGFVHTRDGGRGVGVIGVGGETTVGLATLGRPPYGGPWELRWGPWMMGESDLHGVRAEGGLLLSFGQVRHAQWGTYALRLGGGWGDDALGLRGHVVATLTGGVRYVAGRYEQRGACDPKAKPKERAFASGARLFVTARSTLGEDRAWQLTAGLELEPTFLLPPYALGKWIGRD